MFLQLVLFISFHRNVLECEVKLWGNESISIQDFRNLLKILYQKFTLGERGIVLRCTFGLLFKHVVLFGLPSVGFILCLEKSLESFGAS